MFDDKVCTDVVLDAWRVTSAIAAKKGYKYLSTPLVASNMAYIRNFVAAACDGCSDISCGCPSHIGWHFYANDCRPIELGGYDGFQDKLDQSKAIMEEFPHLKGAIVNEIGMLNCVQDGVDGDCVPNSPSQRYPANQQPDPACPKTDELPNGLGTFVEKLLDMASKMKTSDGRRVVKNLAWFNQDQAGGTYNLKLFDEAGNVNSVGQSYINACQAWGADQAADMAVV